MPSPKIEAIRSEEFARRHALKHPVPTHERIEGSTAALEKFAPSFAGEMTLIGWLVRAQKRDEFPRIGHLVYDVGNDFTISASSYDVGDMEGSWTWAVSPYLAGVARRAILHDRLQERDLPHLFYTDQREGRLVSELDSMRRGGIETNPQRVLEFLDGGRGIGRSVTFHSALEL